MIINELVANSLKYAFPDQSKGEISIDFHKDSSGDHTLVVRDSGVGVPDNIDISTTESLGLHLVHSLTKQLKRDVALDRRNGMAVTVIFPE